MNLPRWLRRRPRHRPRLERLYLFNNGMVAAFNAFGVQVPEAQGSALALYLAELERRGFNVEGVPVLLPSGPTVYPFRIPGGWNYSEQRQPITLENGQVIP